MEESLRSLQVIAESDEARAEVAEMIDIVHGYLTLLRAIYSDPEEVLVMAKIHPAGYCEVWLMESNRELSMSGSAI